jgi:hypothetical protein
MSLAIHRYQYSNCLDPIQSTMYFNKKSHCYIQKTELKTASKGMVLTYEGDSYI